MTRGACGAASARKAFAIVQTFQLVFWQGAHKHADAAMPHCRPVLVSPAGCCMCVGNQKLSREAQREYAVKLSSETEREK